MDSSRITFSCEDIEFQLPDELKVVNWINEVVLNETKSIGFIDYIFCSDNFLLGINQNHLNHDTYTDIITFNYNENEEISGDIFISIDRIRENADKFAVDFEHELCRVIIHGVLHLLGQNDKTEEEQIEMTKKENYCLKQYFN